MTATRTLIELYVGRETGRHADEISDHPPHDHMVTTVHNAEVALAHRWPASATGEV